ncbi:MAG: EFR1 family ferrodoxin [Clostridia bacterium]|nr:EFR1 family ferrodoxin [Clostridia bacterium]
MKKAVLYYFSGTGNTELVAEMVKEDLTGLGYRVDLLRMEDILKSGKKADPLDYDLVGIGCQVIGYAAPNLVYDFLKLLPRAEGKEAFIFRTAGGVHPVNYNASKSMIRRLKRKGYAVFHERIFSIGSNWITKFDEGVMVELYEATKKKVKLMCEEIVRGEKRILKTQLGRKVLMEAAGAVFPPLMKTVGRDLKVSEACTHCGLCIKNCPAANIFEKNGKIRFKWSCNSCLRCVYSCPKKAVHFKTLTFFPVKGGYNIKKLLEKRVPTPNTAGVVPRFFKEYLENDAL